MNNLCFWLWKGIIEKRVSNGSDLGCSNVKIFHHDRRPSRVQIKNVLILLFPKFILFFILKQKRKELDFLNTFYNSIKLIALDTIYSSTFFTQFFNNLEAIIVHLRNVMMQ